VGEAKRRRSLASQDAAAAQGGARPRLSVCLIARNEAPNLPRALGSVRAVADELIVVDTGSTDATVAVARRLGARVEHFAWRDDFAAARNHALSMARAAWILSMDADEELAPESVEPLRRIVRSDPGEPRLLTVEIHSRLDSGLTSVSSLGRILPNLPWLRFRRPVHEELARVDGGPLALVPADGVVLIHHGYQEAERVRQGKAERNLALLERAVGERPDDVASRYYLAVEYGSVGRVAQAARILGAWIDRIERELPRQAAVRALHQHAQALWALGRADDAVAVAVGGAHRHGSPTLHAAAASFLAETSPLEAEREARSALELAGRTRDEVLPRPAIEAAARVVLGDLRRRAGDPDAAGREYQAAAAALPASAAPKVRLAELSAAGGDLTGARRRLLDALADTPHDPASHVALGRVERRLGLLQAAFDRLVEQVAATPRNLELRLELAAVLYEAGEFGPGADVLAAAADLEELAAAGPRFRGGYFERLAHGCLRADRLEAATVAYRTAFQADPSLVSHRAGVVAAPDHPAPSEAAPRPTAAPPGRAAPRA
jgi:glycosyltransferase involved in cell wall biosynthesis